MYVYNPNSGDVSEYDSGLLYPVNLNVTAINGTINKNTVKLGEPIMVDIGGTGDIKCDFKGISPILKNKDEFDQYFISATLQEDKQYDPIEEEKCETCSGCGFH